MKLKDEVLWKVFLGAPYNPADTDIREAELVTGCIDGDNTRNLEVPQKLWMRKWGNESARRSINCDNLSQGGTTGRMIVPWIGTE